MKTKQRPHIVEKPSHVLIKHANRAYKKAYFVEKRQLRMQN